MHLLQKKLNSLLALCQPQCQHRYHLQSVHIFSNSVQIHLLKLILIVTSIPSLSFSPNTLAGNLSLELHHILLYYILYLEFTILPNFLKIYIFISLYLSNPNNSTFPFTSVESLLLSTFNSWHCVLKTKQLCWRFKRKLRSPLSALLPFLIKA